jgi:hypothetical protein
MRFGLAAGLLFGLSIAAAQSEVAPEVLQLSRIKQHMKERLEQVPNYTCLETVERSERLSNTAKFKPIDTVRMEVAQVDGKEMFALPGRQFDQSNPSAFANGGVMANGIFSLHARALFITDSAVFAYAGEEEIDGHSLLRYDFTVSLLRSGYRMVSPPRSAIVAYHGSIWSDPRNLDAYHFRVVAENIPPALYLLDAGLDIEYQNVRIGAADALLPRRADLVLSYFDGRQRRNQITFTGCRQYGSDSVVSFDASPDAAPASAPTATRKPK